MAVAPLAVGEPARPKATVASPPDKATG
jgi:hypothetical protein